MSSAQIIIMAAGRGNRMNSDLPKVMHKIGDSTMLDIILFNSSKVTDDIILVYSHSLIPYIAQYKIKKILQDKPLGTAHAVYSALGEVDQQKNVIVLCGDNPFIDNNIISQMLSNHISNSYDISIMVFNKKNPKGYGRVVMDENNIVKNIIECKDASVEEQKITLCNSGIIIFSPMTLTRLLPDFIASGNNTSSEYYLTSLINIAYNKDLKNGCFVVSDDKIIGVNTQEELAIANNYYAQAKQDAL